MSVAIAHDYLTQRGGAERVVLTLAAMFPGAPVYTSLYNAEQTYPQFAQRHVVSSGLQAVPAFREDPRRAFPLLARAWSTTRAVEDLVIASSSGWAHGIATRPDATKVVYCHNPARWLYQPQDYFSGRAGRLVAGSLARVLRPWDRKNALSADLYVANSSAVAERVRRAYGIEAQVVHPPVNIDARAPQDPDPLLVGRPYWLTVARGRAYKNVPVLVDAVQSRETDRLVVVGPRPPHGDRGSNVYWAGSVSDARLRWLYAHAIALVSVSREDFGLTPLEANSFGTPALLLRAGGFLDSMSEGTSGAWIEATESAAVARAMKDFPGFDREAVRRHAEKFSERSFERKIRELVTARSPRALDGVPRAFGVAGHPPRQIPSSREQLRPA